VIGALVALAVSPVFGFGAAWAMERGARRGLGRATARLNPLVRRVQWPTSALLAFSHGANDAQKSVGVLGVLLLAHGRPSRWRRRCGLRPPPPPRSPRDRAGWVVDRPHDRTSVVRIRPIDGLISQTSSAAVILSASLLGAPASTTQVVASSVVGVGVGRHRYRHVGWRIVGNILLAWVTTLPAAALLAVVFLSPWRWLA
jgi:inorganic phosphate transporter, PiT family